MVSSLPLAFGKLTNSEVLRVDLVQSNEHSAVEVVWPSQLTAIDPTPEAIAGLARGVLRVLGQAQAELAKIRKRPRS